MSAANPIAIPGLERHRPPTILRLTISEVVADRPTLKKGDRFHVTRPALDDDNHYVVDRELQAALESVAGEKPVRVPIVVWSNNLDCLDQRRNCQIGKSRGVCRSAGFHLKTAEECRAQHIPYPAPDETCKGDEYYVGRARIRAFEAVPQEKNGQPVLGRDGKPIFKQVCTGTQERVCDPAFCPFATGDMTQLDKQTEPYREDMRRARDQQARKFCKFNSVLAFTLDLPNANRAGAYAKFFTTSIWSAGFLKSSLEQIYVEAGTWLMGLPLDLVLKVHRKSTPTTGMQNLPYVYVESRMPAGQLRAHAEQISLQLEANAQRRNVFAQHQRVTTAIVRAEITPDEAAEFYRADPAENTVRDYRVEVEDLGHQAGLSETVIAADVAKCTGDADLLALVAEYRAMLTETPPGEDLGDEPEAGEILDGEFEPAGEEFAAPDAPPLKETWAADLQKLGESLGLSAEKAAEKVAAAVAKGPDECAALETTWRRQAK